MGSNAPLASRLVNKLAACSSAQEHAPGASAFVGESIAQQMVGDGIQLSDQPVLGPAGMQPQASNTGNHAFQSAAALQPDLTAASDRSSACASVATTAATEALLADSHRSSNTALTGEAEARGAADTVQRAASPPFLFEEDAGEDSLVDFRGPGYSDAAPEIAFPPRGDVAPANHEKPNASRTEAHSQSAHAVPSGGASQQASENKQMRPSCSAIAEVAAQPDKLDPCQATGPREHDHLGPLAQGTSAVAQTALRPASAMPLYAQIAERPVNTPAAAAAALTHLAMDAPSCQPAGATPAARAASKVNEVGMARAIRQAGHSRLEKQAAVRAPKPMTSSKVDCLCCSLAAHYAYNLG